MNNVKDTIVIKGKCIYIYGQDCDARIEEGTLVGFDFRIGLSTLRVAMKEYDNLIQLSEDKS